MLMRGRLFCALADLDETPFSCSAQVAVGLKKPVRSCFAMMSLHTDRVEGIRFALCRWPTLEQPAVNLNFVAPVAPMQTLYEIFLERENSAV
jgi:hypothetical protein